jgi:hypothetical protein
MEFGFDEVSYDRQEDEMQELSGLFGVAHIRFLHGATDEGAVNIFVNNRLFARNVKFTEITDYMRVRPGRVNIRIVSAVGSNRPILVDNITISPFFIATIAITGNDNELKLTVINDPNMPPLLDVARFRVSNLTDDVPRVDVVQANGRVLFRNVDRGETTRYISMQPGRYRIHVKRAGTEDIVLRVPNVVLRQRRNITMYILGSVVGRNRLKAVLPLDGNTYLFDEQF